MATADHARALPLPTRADLRHLADAAVARLGQWACGRHGHTPERAGGERRCVDCGRKL